MKNILSLCMIVKNEEDTLPNCLNSVKGIFDEIIIVDTGSTDKTIDVAHRYTEKVYTYSWQDDFASARNYSFSKSTSDYIMWLDADDILLPDDAIKLMKLKLRLSNYEEVAAKYNVGFDEDGNVTLEYYRERIFLNNGKFQWSGKIHETIPIIQGCHYADFAVTHHKLHPTECGRNLKIFEKMIADGEELDARNLFYYARELFYNDKIDRATEKLESFLSMPDGYIENKIDACSILAACYRVNNKNPLDALFKSFQYAEPRAEICCDIGEYFANLGRINLAIYWYKEALNKTPPNASGAFISRDCYDFIPLLQLCVLYYALGDEKQAKENNEKAASIKPNNAAVIYNKNFFNRKK